MSVSMTMEILTRGRVIALDYDLLDAVPLNPRRATDTVSGMDVDQVRFKVCCIANADEAAMAVRAGASAVGLVAAMPSGPGIISEEEIAAIARSVPPGVASVLLTSETDPGRIAAQQRRCGTNAVQLCRPVAPECVLALRRELAGIVFMPVVHVEDESAIDESLRLAAVADAILLDSGRMVPPDGGPVELGGTGRTHDWSTSAAICRRSPKPVFLAGGLNPDNVAAAVRAVRPYGVDICSGLRPEKMKLDAGRLSTFARTLRRVGGSGSTALAAVSILVRDYDEAIAFYRDCLGMVVFEDTPLNEEKRWVVVGPANGRGSRLVLAKARGEQQVARVGDQTGGRVGFFLETDDFARNHAAFSARGVKFAEAPRAEPYGKVAVFEDCCGNRWDLIEPK